MKDIKTVVRDYIMTEFLPGETPAALADDTPLRTGGILDSMSLIQLVGFVEQRYGIEVEAHETGVENFDRIEDIASFIDRKRRGH